MHCTLVPRLPASSFRSSASKIPRKPASVFPLPVGEVSKIDSRSRIAGTANNCAWVKPAKFSRNHSASRGCKRAVSKAGMAPTCASIRPRSPKIKPRANVDSRYCGEMQSGDYRVASRWLERATFTPMDASYFDARYKPHPGRRRVWKAIAEYLQKFIAPSSRVADIGAGYCDFINQIRAATKYAVDTNLDVAGLVGPGVQFAPVAAIESIDLPEHSLDVVLMSNILEHLSHER